MIRRHHRQRPIGDATPQRHLICSRADGRIHLAIRPQTHIVIFGKKQIMRTSFGGNIQPIPLKTPHHLQSMFTCHMGNVNGRTHRLGQGQNTRNRHRFYHWRARFHMRGQIHAPRRPQRIYLRFKHRIAFAMHHQPPPSRLGQLQGLIQLVIFGQTNANKFIIAAQGGAMHKNLEGNRPHLCHAQHIIANEGTRCAIQRHIYNRLLLDLLAAVRKRRRRGTTRIRDRHLKNRRHATSGGGAGFGIKIATHIMPGGSAMPMNINRARQHPHAIGI